jgi:uncharacterized protein YceK
MLKFTPVLVALVILAGCKSETEEEISGPGAVTYPETAMTEQTDNYFGTDIADERLDQKTERCDLRLP